MLRPILLVEDNEQDEILTIRALRKNNVANEVHVARDGAEALAYLGLAVGGEDLSETPPQLPQIVLLDLKLPKIDGLEVLKEIRANPRTQILPVVILTTSKEERDIAKGYSLGANSYVRKPVDFNTFIEAIRQLGLYWLILNEGPADQVPAIGATAPMVTGANPPSVTSATPPSEVHETSPTATRAAEKATIEDATRSKRTPRVSPARKPPSPEAET